MAILTGSNPSRRAVEGIPGQVLAHMCLCHQAV